MLCLIRELFIQEVMLHRYRRDGNCCSHEIAMPFVDNQSLIEMCREYTYHLPERGQHGHRHAGSDAQFDGNSLMRAPKRVGSNVSYFHCFARVGRQCVAAGMW